MMMESLVSYANSLDWSPGKTKHEQTHLVLLRAASLGINPSGAAKIVIEKVLEAQGKVDSAGIIRQCRRAYEFVSGKSTAYLPENALPRLNQSSFTKPKLKNFSIDKLRQKTASFEGQISREWFLERSPKHPRDPHEFLKELYPVGESVAVLLKLKQRKPQFIWNHDLPHLGELASDEGVFFLPNPVTGNRHLVDRLKSENNPQGETWRSAEAVTAWRYMLLESDLDENNHPGMKVEWLKFIALLNAPVVSIVGSGGKSVHALLKVDASSKDDWDRKVRPFKEPLRELGADVGALSAVRLTRLPHCFRSGALQSFYYCDPDATSVPIAKKGGLLK